MNREQAFWDRMAARYIRRPIGNPEAYERKLALTRSYLSPEMRVLEIGCGSGNTGREHAPLVARYTGIDLSPEMIRLGRAEAPLPDNMTMDVADCDSFDMAPGAYDMVLALSLLHLVPDPESTVARIAATLAPGGVFVSSTAAIAHLWWLGPVLRGLAALGKVPRINFFRPDDIRALMRDAGLVIEVDESPNGKSTLFLIARKPG